MTRRLQRPPTPLLQSPASHPLRISLLFPCYFLFFPVPDPAISADVLDGTHFLQVLAVAPPPLSFGQTNPTISRLSCPALGCFRRGIQQSQGGGRVRQPYQIQLFLITGSSAC